MSKKNQTQSQPNKAEQLLAKIDENGKDIEVLAVTEPKPVTINPTPDATDTQPTYNERLANFLNSHGKLITLDAQAFIGSALALQAKIDANEIAEHPDVANAKAEIDALNTKLGEIGMLPDDYRQFAEIGLRAKLAEQQAIIDGHKDDNPVQQALLKIFFGWHDAGLVKFGKTSKRRSKSTRTSKPQIGDADVWPFSYKTDRKLKDGTRFEVPLTEGYIFGPSHPKVIEAKVLNPSDKIIVTTREGLVMGHLSKSLSKSALLGQAVAIVGGLGDDAPAKVSETGISGLSNGRTEELAKSVPTPHASILTNGQNSEVKAQTVGSRATTEKETA